MKGKTMFRFFWFILLVSIISAFALTSCSEADDEVRKNGDMELETMCPIEGDLGAGNHAITLEYDGMERGYEFYVPESYDSSTPTPLILNIPGFKMLPDVESSFTLLNQTADEKGFIVVYPMSFDGIWNTGIPPAIGEPGDLEDVGFIRAVMEDIPTRICADKSRVYATGMSMGASMAYRLACEATDFLTAIAPIAGALGVSCNPSRPLPVLHIHGIEDTLVPYDDGEASLQKWLELNGCKGTPEVEEFNESYCETYTDCENDTSVVLCSMTPMGHCWPGGSEDMCILFWKPYNNDLNANDYMWDFFTQYQSH